MKKLISLIVSLAVLFAIFIWPLDIFDLDLMDEIFGAGTQQRVEDTAGINEEEARHGTGKFFSCVGDALSK